MAYELIPFTEIWLQPAVELFTQKYNQERILSPQLPELSRDTTKQIFTALQSQLNYPGVAVIEGNHILAYMITGNIFPWKGQQAAIVPEYAHGAVEENKQRLYQIMVQFLAQEWVKSSVHLHLIGHFSHDTDLKETLFQIGFGGLVVERLREPSSIIPEMVNSSIKEVQDMNKLIDLHSEHIRYYPNSPIFLTRSINRNAALADLESHVRLGDVVTVFYENNEPRGYFIIGEVNHDGEGFLLRKTKTAQIKSAYVQPEIRNKGVGVALLQNAVLWAKQHGYERIFVEHETANIYGGNFWSKYFEPYLNFSMRYVDNTIKINQNES